MALSAFNSYAHMSMSAGPQTLRLAINNHIELDTLGFIGTDVDGDDVVLSTGAGQANGNITLKNRRYLVRVEVWGATDEGFVLVQLCGHGVTTPIVDESGAPVPWAFLNDSNANDQTMPAAFYFMVDATGGDVEFRLMFQNINTILTNVDARVQVYPLNAADGGSTFDSYAKVYLSALQSTNLNLTNHVEFDSIARVGTVADASKVLLSTGAGQADGIVTLKTYRYLVITNLNGATNEGRGGFEWTDGSGVQIADELGITQTPRQLWIADCTQSDVTNAPASSWQILDATGGDIVMELRVIGDANLTTVYDTSTVLIIPIMES